jgi:hypothetical protein
MLAGNNPGAYEQISTVYSTGAFAQIDFNSIPQTYRHLQLRIVARTTNSVQQSQTNGMAINGNTTNGKYHGHSLTGNGSSVASSASGFFNLAFQIPFVPGANATAGAFGAQIIDFLDYSSTTKNKTIRAFGGYPPAGGNNIGLFSNLFIDTGAITSIQYNFMGPNFAAGSRFSLYGVKG